MKPSGKTLALTELERDHGHERRVDGSPMSARVKRTKTTRAMTARTNQIAVGAAPTASYAVDDRDGHATARSTIAVRSPVDRPSHLQRSQTAVSGLHRPRANTLDLELPPRALPRNKSRRDAVRQDHHDGTPIAATASAFASSAKRLYDDMIDSEEVAILCKRLGVAPKDVWRLRKEFTDEGTDNADTITLSSFFHLIREDSRALTRSILCLAGLTASKGVRLPFDAYLQCIVTFASFSEPELFEFFFHVYCDNAMATNGGAPSSRALGESDLTRLGKDLQVLRTAFAGNVQIATGNAVAAVTQGIVAAGSLTFADFERFSRQHMVAFYPLLQIQRNVRLAGDLGEAFWIEKTTEKRHLQYLLAYMKTHHGFQPPLSLRDRFVRFVLQRPTMQTRVRERAKQLYTG